MSTRVFLLAAALLVALPSLAQTGHPAKGSWAGFLEPLGFHAERERIRLLINAQNGELSGVINPGRNAVDADIELDPETWTLSIEADMPDGSLELNGTLDNLGSWTNRRYHGVYTLGDQSGTFTIFLN